MTQVSLYFGQKKQGNNIYHYITTPKHKRLIIVKDFYNTPFQYEVTMPSLLWKIIEYPVYHNPNFKHVFPSHMFALKSTNLGSRLYVFSVPNIHLNGAVCNSPQSRENKINSKLSLSNKINISVAQFFDTPFNKDYGPFMEHAYKSNSYIDCFALWEKSFENYPWQTHYSQINPQYYNLPFYYERTKTIKEYLAKEQITPDIVPLQNKIG